MFWRCFSAAGAAKLSLCGRRQIPSARCASSHCYRFAINQAIIATLFFVIEIIPSYIVEKWHDMMFNHAVCSTKSKSTTFSEDENDVVWCCVMSACSMTGHHTAVLQAPSIAVPTNLFYILEIIARQDLLGCTAGSRQTSLEHLSWLIFWIAKFGLTLS